MIKKIFPIILTLSIVITQGYTLVPTKAFAVDTENPPAAENIAETSTSNVNVDKFDICHFPPGNPNNPQILNNQKWEAEGENGHSNHPGDFIINSPEDEARCVATTPPLDTTAPGMPVHISPADNSIMASIALTELDWTDSIDDNSNPVTYTYQVAGNPAINGDGSFASPHAITVPGLTNSVMPSLNTPNGDYYWHVKATDDEGNSTNWTNPWKLTITDVAPPPQPPVDPFAVPNCPVQPADGRIIVNFPKKKLVSDPSYGETATEGSFVGPINASIPIGNYKVTLSAFDGYPGRETTPAQSNEKYLIKLFGIDDTLIAISGITGDLDDGVATTSRTDIVDPSLNVSEETATIEAYHPFHPDTSNANSVYPICAVFDLLNGDDNTNGTTTPPTATSTLIVTKIIVGGTATTTDFNYFVDGSTVLSGIATTTTIGTHVVTETNPNLLGYDATFGGDCDQNGNVVVVASTTAQCTITNTFGGQGGGDDDDVVTGTSGTGSTGDGPSPRNGSHRRGGGSDVSGIGGGAGSPDGQVLGASTATPLAPNAGFGTNQASSSFAIMFYSLIASVAIVSFFNRNKQCSIKKA